MTTVTVTVASTRQVRLADGLRARIVEKFAHLARYAPDLERVEVTIDRDGNGTRFDGHLHRCCGRALAAHAIGRSVYEAMERLHARCRKVLRRRHGREVDRRHAA